MKKILQGVKQFQTKVYPEHKDRFEALAESQDPDVLFITCSDSRIDPNLITQSNPGELFICRNAGNIVPPHTIETGGMTASIEYAVSVLGVRHIIICGHSNCGAMKAVIEHDQIQGLPHVKEWLDNSRAAKEAVECCHQHIDQSNLDEVTKQNVVLQLKHLATHPAVFSKLYNEQLELHGWVYDIKTGKVEAYDERLDTFVTL
jgi:carbonic anhydrase